MKGNTARRKFLSTVLVAVSSVIAGCFNEDTPKARCAGTGDGDFDGPLRRVQTITGQETILLGILVDDEITEKNEHNAILVRNREDTLVAEIPLLENRGMNRLDPEDYPAFSNDGELYAVTLGPPPQHGNLTVELVDENSDVIQSVTQQFNCYSQDGEL